MLSPGATEFVQQALHALLWSLEQGSAYRREEAERRALALLRPILASAAAAEAPVVPHVRAESWSITETAPKPRLS